MLFIIPGARHPQAGMHLVYSNCIQGRCMHIKVFKKDGLGLFVIKPGTPTCGRRTPGFLKLLLCGRLYVCVCSPPRLTITSDMIWTPYGLHMDSI